MRRRLPEWVGERPFLILNGSRVVAAFWVREEAEAYASKRNLKIVER